ncbi:b8.2 [Ichnoviriform fugitivi]|uniref:B8.2 n=1 Tax=Ichnoviriform fugitivi TaxID=265522 RepID=Q6PL40_9VIRU|nr:b8.2 [Ichnoviriform fugitivi]AAT09009.1 b8.2 [Ichnoviriform fugitivi]
MASVKLVVLATHCKDAENCLTNMLNHSSHSCARLQLIIVVQRDAYPMVRHVLDATCLRDSSLSVRKGTTVSPLDRWLRHSQVAERLKEYYSFGRAQR